MSKTITATVTLDFEMPDCSDADEQRERIAEDIGRLYDADTTTGVACTGFEIDSLRRAPSSRIHFLCAGCGSPDIRADAYADWEVKAGAWVLHSVYDEKSCEKCGSSCSLIEVDEATGLEIQAFAMVNGDDGARQAENGETPAFYDVMVTTNPNSDGEIHTLHEIDDLSHAQMEKAVAVMQDTYPLAPVNCHFRDVWQS
ncbi:MAG: hypothetical protein AAFW87_08070 [Pseudomonadota bacterium]